MGLVRQRSPVTLFTVRESCGRKGWWNVSRKVKKKTYVSVFSSGNTRFVCGLWLCVWLSVLWDLKPSAAVRFEVFRARPWLFFFLLWGDRPFPLTPASLCVAHQTFTPVRNMTIEKGFFPKLWHDSEVSKPTVPSVCSPVPWPNSSFPGVCLREFHHPVVHLISASFELAVVKLPPPKTKSRS